MELKLAKLLFIVARMVSQQPDYLYCGKPLSAAAFANRDLFGRFLRHYQQARETSCTD